jgi:hypothetical protein
MPVIFIFSPMGSLVKLKITTINWRFQSFGHHGNFNSVLSLLHQLMASVLFSTWCPVDERHQVSGK